MRSCVCVFLSLRQVVPFRCLQRVFLYCYDKSDKFVKTASNTESYTCSTLEMKTMKNHFFFHHHFPSSSDSWVRFFFACLLRSLSLSITMITLAWKMLGAHSIRIIIERKVDGTIERARVSEWGSERERNIGNSNVVIAVIMLLQVVCTLSVELRAPSWLLCFYFTIILLIWS